MSLEKAILHKKEYRRPYHKGDSRNFDWSCRNHKSCPWCRNNRLRKTFLLQLQEKEERKLLDR